jgi:hypothetical protein
MKGLVSQGREAQVDGVIHELLGGSVSTDTRQVLLTGTNPFLAARAATADSMAMADSMSAFSRPSRITSLQGLMQIVGLALGAPEFQRR